MVCGPVYNSLGKLIQRAWDLGAVTKDKPCIVKVSQGLWAGRAGVMGIMVRAGLVVIRSH